MIKVIVFDWIGTLSLGIPEGYFPVRKMKRKFALSDRSIKKCIEILDNWEPPFKPATIKEQRRILVDFWQSVAKQIGIKNPSLFIDYLLKWSFDDVTAVLFPEALSVIEYLSKKNYKLVVLSNGWPSRLLEIKRSKIGNYFRIILVSNIIGAKKPETEAYQIAIKRIGLLSDEILFVDNKEEYLVPARGLGMNVILMDREDSYTNSEFFRIKNLEAIKHYFQTRGD